jgi:hypothetical protein
MTAASCLLSLQRSSAAHKVNDEHDHSDNEQQMNERATKMTDEAKQPEHQQDYKYCPQHRDFLSVESYLPSREAVLLRLSKCKFSVTLWRR